MTAHGLRRDPPHDQTQARDRTSPAREIHARAGPLRFRRSVRRLRHDHRRRSARDGRAPAETRQPRAPASPALLRDLDSGARVAPERARAAPGDGLTGLASALLAVLGGPAAPREIARGVDQPDVRERLRKVAQESPRARIVLLGQKADVVADVAKALEECARLGLLALQREIVGQPEAAREKGALTRGQPVELGDGLVSRHEAIGREATADGLDGSEHARILRRKESDERNHQEARVEQLRAVVLQEGAELPIEPVLAHVRVDRGADVSPALDGAVEPEALHRFDGTIERDPRHHLRVRERPARTANLPDALIGFLPRGLDEFDQRGLEAPRVLVGLEPDAPGIMVGVRSTMRTTAGASPAISMPSMSVTVPVSVS